ncbi:MAG TPA: hypothetical protein VHX38_33255 [Pseudonocardiaceae bacterium]|jgi:hypothetical protein|nr:hypothetical protein [Pseudonocardiaceae bacterium]
MAVDDLPGPVVNLLNVIGVPWPYVNEDTVTQFATLTRQFGQAVQTTHADATQAVSGIAQAHQGASTQRMSSGWATMSSQHVDELVTACNVLADALDVGAGYIVAQKLEALATLIGMAIAFVADQAASVVTLGLAETAVPLIIEGAERLVKSLVMDLQQYLIGQVIEAAAKPLFAKVEAAMAGLDWSKSGSGDSASAGSGFTLDAAAVRTHTAALRTHAATMRQHGANFQQGVQGLSF